MDPPLLKFLTKVYHPNIDSDTGSICLDLLKMPPQGKWRPINNLSSILTAVQQLLSDPNPHDPLVSEIVSFYFCFKLLGLINGYNSMFIKRLKSTFPTNPCLWKQQRDGLNSMQL
jgi:hypothetical protein